MWVGDGIKPADLNVDVCMCVQVFAEALLHVALHPAGPAAADGEDVGPPPLEAGAESVARVAGGGVGGTEAARGREGGAGAARREQAG